MSRSIFVSRSVSVSQGVLVSRSVFVSRGVFVGRTSVFLLVTGILSVALPVFAAPVPADHSCMGPWVGRGRNSNSNTYWTIDLTLSAAPDGGRCGTVEYTNPTCGGTLEACRLVGNDIHTREAYSHRAPDCAPPGRVIIRCEGDTMRYSWIGWERVNSTLRRPEGYVHPTRQPEVMQPSGTDPAPPNPTAPEDGVTPTPPIPVETPAQDGVAPTPTPVPPVPLNPPVPPAPPPPQEIGCGCRTVGGAVPTPWLGGALVLLAMIAVRTTRRG